jgi:hypothetical protein
MSINDQQLFWKEQYAKDYISKNDNYDLAGGVKCWATMLQRTEPIISLLECGSNVGKNIRILTMYYPLLRNQLSKSVPKPIRKFPTDINCTNLLTVPFWNLRLEKKNLI